MKYKKRKNKINIKYPCNLLSKIFTFKKNLYRHKRECHLKQNFKKCSFCSRYYPRIREHILRCLKNKNLTLFRSFIDSDINSNQYYDNNNRAKMKDNPYFERNDNIDRINIFRENKDLTGKFEITNKFIGKGTFGVVYFGFDLEKGIPIAIKCIKNNKENINNFSKEVNFLNELKEENFFPIIFYAEFNNRNKIIIQSLLGATLKDLLYLCGGRLPLFSVLNIAIELFNRIKVIHNHKIIHRDINLSNIIFGNFSTSNNHEKYGLYIIDYGLSTKFLDDKNNHYDYSKNCKFVGTLEYASIHTHSKEKQSRRDDIESIFYVILRLLKGELPWKINKQSLEKTKLYEMVKKIKNNFIDSDEFKELPPIFKFIYKNIKILEFEEEPPYNFFITLLENEKEIILKNENTSKEKFKYFWLNLIEHALYSKV